MRSLFNFLLLRPQIEARRIKELTTASSIKQKIKSLFLCNSPIFLLSTFKKPKTLSEQVHSQYKVSHFLMITTSGGGGHLQAAQARKLDLKAKNPHICIYEKNIVEAVGGKLFGKFMIDCIWNTAQRKGSVKALNLCAFSIPLFDYLFWIPIFFQISYLLYRHQIEYVIDTQPLTTSSITSAVRLYRFFTKRAILIDKVLTELPTKQSSHYLRPIKKLCKKNRALIRLMTTYPLLTDDESEEDFWRLLSGLKQKQIIYQSLPIRPAFKMLEKKPKSFETLNLIINLKNDEEKHLLEKILSKGNVKNSIDQDKLTITLKPEDIVLTLMLGSQPMQQASLDYVLKFINLIKESRSSLNYIFFIFCSDKKFEKIPLQTRIASLVTNVLDYPANITIVPMSSQTDKIIAPLYFRSNATITKAGGITSMELLSVANGKIWIHHERHLSLIQKLLKTTPSYGYTYKGMPKWEYGNALYLERKKGASLITTESFPIDCAQYFDLNNKNCDPIEQMQTLSNS